MHMKETIKVTAKNFHKNPAAVYRLADKGHDVVITHDRYPGIIFVLVVWEPETENGD